VTANAVVAVVGLSVTWTLTLRALGVNENMILMLTLLPDADAATSEILKQTVD
jgi:hypothetical protein